MGLQQQAVIPEHQIDDFDLFNKTERYAAKYAGTSVATLRRLRGSGQGPQYRKLNGFSVRYSLRSLKQWTDAQPAFGAGVKPPYKPRPHRTPRKPVRGTAQPGGAA